MVKSLTHALVVFMVCILLGFGVSACGGGGAEIKSEVSTTTTGQQLMDLKKALDQGAITQKEYEQERMKVLNRK